MSTLKATAWAAAASSVSAVISWNAVAAARLCHLLGWTVTVGHLWFAERIVWVMRLAGLSFTMHGFFPGQTFDPPVWLARHLSPIFGLNWPAMINHGVFPVAQRAAGAADLAAAATFGITAIGAVGLIALKRWLDNHPAPQRGGIAALPAPKHRPVPVEIAQYRLPDKTTRKHILITGATQSGKSNTLWSVMRGVRKRGERAIVVDKGGEFAQYGYSPGRGDIILNPFDARTVRWSPLAEIDSPAEAFSLARSIIPPGQGNSAEWHEYATQMADAVIQQMVRRGETDVARLRYFLAEAPFRRSDDDPRESLGDLLHGTEYESLVDSDDITKAVIDTRNLIKQTSRWMSYLARVPDERARAFEIDQWLEHGEGWIWLTFRAKDLESQKTMISAFLDQMISHVLDLPPHRRRPIWGLVDELQSLGQIASIKNALPETAKFGLRWVLAFQNIEQVREIYGRDGAHALIAQPATWVAYNPGGAETARAVSDQLGGRYELVESESHKAGEGKTTNKSEQWRPWLTATDLLALPDNRGVLWTRGNQKNADEAPARIQIGLPKKGRPRAAMFTKADWARLRPDTTGKGGKQAMTDADHTDPAQGEAYSPNRTSEGSRRSQIANPPTTTPPRAVGGLTMSGTTIETQRHWQAARRAGIDPADMNDDEHFDDDPERVAEAAERMDDGETGSGQEPRQRVGGTEDPGFEAV